MVLAGSRHRLFPSCSAAAALATACVRAVSDNSSYNVNEQFIPNGEICIALTAEMHKNL